MNGKSLRVRAVSIIVLMVSLGACSSPPNAAPAPDPSAVLQALPSADREQYDRIEDMKKWRNPYLIIREDGVALFDAADSAEIILKTDEVLPALARLPATNWPYGRVVAVGENGGKTLKQDYVAIRRTRGIMGGILQGAHVAVKWVPSN